MFRVPKGFRWWRGILAILLGIPLLAVAFVFWRASHARDEAAAEVLSKSEFSFSVVPVDRVAPAAVRNNFSSRCPHLWRWVSAFA
jgi:hypothetical protein